MAELLKFSCFIGNRGRGTVPLLWTWLSGRYHVPQNVFLVISTSPDYTHTDMITQYTFMSDFFSNGCLPDEYLCHKSLHFSVAIMRHVKTKDRETTQKQRNKN